MSFKSFIWATGAYLLFTTASPALGSVIYSYTGNTYDIFYNTNTSYTNEMAVTGTIELSEPLTANMDNYTVTPISFSFNDGIRTITQDEATPWATHIIFSTDDIGAITQWFISIDTAFLFPGEIGDTRAIINTILADDIPPDYVLKPQDTGFFTTCIGFSAIGEPCDIWDTDAAYSTIAPGTWTVVPIPAAVWLFGSGLIGLIGVARRKKA